MEHFIGRNFFTVVQRESQYAVQKWQFKLAGSDVSLQFIQDNGMWGNHHFRFSTEDRTEGGHLIGVHQIKPNRYSPVHILPHDNGDIVFAAIAGSGLLVAHADSISEEFEAFELNKHTPLIKLKGNIMYCLFADGKGIELAYLARPFHEPQQEEIIAPGLGIGSPQAFWGKVYEEVVKREENPATGHISRSSIV